MKRVVAYVPDLMDRSRLTAAGKVEFVGQPDELAEATADLVLVDLMRPGVLEVLPAIAGRVVGFARHEREDVMAAARAVGCHEALTRAVFFRRLPELLSG
jgi:hypothetical protein